MVIEINVVLWILVAHFIADFILQSDYVAQNKSKSNRVLAQHVLIYGIPFALLSLVIPITIEWLLINVIAHFVVDFVTSRVTSKLWAAKQVHWFFVVIGFDQLLHYLTLIGTYYIFC